MRKLLSMFIPDYTITPNILKNIVSTEYSRAVIDSTTMLFNFEGRLEKLSYIEFVYGSLFYYKETPNKEFIKKQVENLIQIRNTRVDNLIKSRHLAKDSAVKSEIDENLLKKICKTLAAPDTQVLKYRIKKIENKVNPEEILADISELFSWYSSMDAKDTNPILVAGILKARLDVIQPFENFNFITSNLIALSALHNRGYKIIDFLNLENYYNNSRDEYEEIISSLLKEPVDYTQWLEYFTEAFASQTTNITQTIKLYSKDDKLAKFNSKRRLTDRQEKIIEYLHDYKELENKHFPILFPNISEDTVLREIKKLTDSGIIIKTGSTKSSRYELA